MMCQLYRSAVILCLLFAVGSVWAFAETIDRVVAVIGDDVILESELAREVYLYSMQFGLEVTSEEQLEELRSAVLERMIENRILLAEAKRDTIEPSETEVEESLNSAIQEIISRFPSEEAFQQQVAQQGMTVEGLRGRYREEIRNRLFVDGLIERRLKPGILVSGREVEEFYRTHVDSIPPVPARVTLSHVLIGIVPGPAMETAARERAQAILGLVKQGEDFAMLARRFSEDQGSAGQGGDLGYFRRGEMMPEFEAAAFALEPGEVSDIVRTEFGYHILRCEAKEADRVRVSHILVLLLPGPEDAMRARARADSVRAMAVAGENFATLARRYSDDPETRDRGGSLGTFAVDDLGPELQQAIEGLEPGDVSRVVESEVGYHILRLDGYEPSRRPTYDEIKGSLKEYLFQTKLEEKSAQWIEKLEEEIYVENRLAAEKVEGDGGEEPQSGGEPEKGVEESAPEPPGEEGR
jgi:peptidyl-prolyl cis-trans isomerase SurA